MEERDNVFADIITERPYEFTVGRKHFRLYPVTLAKTFLLKQHIDGLSVNWGVLRINPYVEALRLVEAERKRCCQILAIHTAPNTYKDLYNRQAMATRRNAFKAMSAKDIATLLLYVLKSDKTDSVLKETGLEEERRRLQQTLAIKSDTSRNNMTFGGLTILGSFIAPLMEMGFTHSEILYERSYSYLRLMLADKVTSLYLTDDEYGKLPPSVNPNILNGDDPESFGKLQSLLAGKGIKIKQ